MLWKDEPTTPSGTEENRLQCRAVFQSSVSKLAESHLNTQDATIQILISMLKRESTQRKETSQMRAL